MATQNVLFSRGLAANFPNINKDPNTLYFLKDTHEIYLGSERYAFGDDINIVYDGVESGDVISNIVYDPSSKTLTIKQGKASDAQSIHNLLDAALEGCIKEIRSERGSSILVDTDRSTGTSTLSLNIARDAHAGNVILEECSDGLRANVDISEFVVPEVAPNDKILSIDGNQLKTQLSINAIKENDRTYVVLQGNNGVEISRFDAADFVKDGFLDNVRLEYSTDGLNHRVLVFTFNTDSGKEVIKIDIQDLVDVYIAESGGGLKLSNNAFSIDNTVEASDYINSNVSPAFGETITLNTIKFDGHGLITGKGSFTFKMPSLAEGHVGDDNKLLKFIEIGDDGSISGETIDISTSLSANSTDDQIPTAKAVWDAIEDSKTVWEEWI